MKPTDIGLQHMSRMEEQMDRFDASEIGLGRLVGDLEALIGLLLDEADRQWAEDLQSEWIRLEFVHAAASEGGRVPITDDETKEIGDAIRQLRHILRTFDY